MNNLDEMYMSYALSLAKKGKYTTGSNPNVGCVIVKDNRIIGEGYHKKFGENHAEINALEMVKEKNLLIGSTVYVTLEPCSHYGKTPPCSDSLIKFGIKKVFISMLDPNQKVFGNGVKKLKQSNIEVVCGLLKEESEYLNIDYIKRMRTGYPYIQLKLACSLDGRIALSSGESKWITSVDSREDVQKCRARSCAILTTGSTVFFDDPYLNVRWSSFPKVLKDKYFENLVRQPVRVILDINEQVNISHKIVNLPGKCYIIRPRKSNIQWNKNIEEIIFQSKNGRFNLFSLFKKLGELDINSVFVECGSGFSGELLKLNLIDQLIIYIAPKIFGKDSKPLTCISGIKNLNDVFKFKFIKIKKLKDDLKLILNSIK